MSLPFKGFAVELWEDESGGYGGIFKSIIRIVVPIAVSFIPGAGPLAIAASSALTTVATGGSFTEALLAGATSFIGSSITQGITSGLGTLEGPSFFSPLDDAFSGGIASGAVSSAASSAAISGASLLSDVVSPAFLAANADIIGRVVGGLATLTLNQALNQEIPGLEQELDQRFGPDASQSLQQQARDEQLEEVFQELIGPNGVPNPFLREGQDPEANQEAINAFTSTIARGIRRADETLGLDVTPGEFDAVFRNPNLGANILGEEVGIQQGGFNTSINDIFTGDAFAGRPPDVSSEGVAPGKELLPQGDAPFNFLDDEIIQSIIDERRGPAQEQVSRFEARGNLNPLGGQTANEFLGGQVGPAKERLGEVRQGVLTANQGAVNDIRDRARTEVGGFKLGDDLFDVEPFGTERSNLISQREGSFRGDILSNLGSEPLFDVTGALQTAGRAQGVVSGTPNPSFLDAIAAREGSAPTRKRGLGSRGSGGF